VTSSLRRTLDRRECMERLAGTGFGRVVVAAGGLPQVFPVNFVVHRGRIIFRTDPGAKLTWSPGAEVAFEVDTIDADGRGWVVVARGPAGEIDSFDGPVRPEGLRSLGVDPWAGGDRIHWISIQPMRVDGHEVSARLGP
jgi:uncharacterized protein